MRKLFRLLFKLLFRLIGLTILVVLPIFLYNTFTLSSQQVHVDPIAQVDVDKQAIHRLAKAVQLPTISTKKGFDSLAFHQLDTLITQSFPLVDSLLEKEVINDFSFIYRWPGLQTALPPILLIAHTDVVPIEDEAAWSYDPFSGKIKNDTLYGRGALDDKMSVMGMLEAAEVLLQKGYQPARTIYFAFGHDEEVGGIKGAQTIAGIFNYRDIKFEYILDEGLVILEDALDALDQPLAMIGVAEKGYATLTLEVHLEQGGHSSMPPSQTAVGILSAAVDRLQQQPFPAKIDGATEQFFDYIAPEMSFFHKMLFANRWATNSLIINQFKK